MAMAGDVADAYVSDVDDERSTATDSPGANPSRDGDAKPGISSQGVTTRPPGCRVGGEGNLRSCAVIKANLARITVALVILASLALTLGAGIRWD